MASSSSSSSLERQVSGGSGAAPPRRSRLTLTTALVFAIAMMLVGWKSIFSTVPLPSSSSSSSFSFATTGGDTARPSFPRLALEPVVIGTLQEEEAAEAKAAVAAAGMGNRVPPPIPVDYQEDSGDIVPIEDAVKRYFDRFDVLTQRPSSEPYTLTECRDAALHCGFACGSRREEFESCWCVRVWKRTVAYLPKGSEKYGGEFLDSWRATPFANLQMTLNLLWATVQTKTDLLLETPVYLVVNVYDYPRLFLPQPAHEMGENVPPVTLGHPAENTHLGYEFYAQVAFTGGFPQSVEPCQQEEEEEQEDLEPRHRCCNSTHHFPLFSWSVNPAYNFDIVAPNRHPGSCGGAFFDERIGQVPWQNKTRTLLFRGSSKCHALQTGDHRSRFCAHVQSQRLFLEASLNLTIDIYGDQLEPYQQAEAQFLVLLDGAVAAFRSTWYLSTGSVILAAGTQVDFRTALLRPYVHYIPFSADYSDFGQALELVARNDEYAQWVAANARRAGRVLSERNDGILDGGHEGDKSMWAALLQEYQSRYAFVMSDDELNAQFTSETNCDSFLECGSECRPIGDHCLGEEYACQGKVQDGFPLKEGVVTYFDRSQDEDDKEEQEDTKDNATTDKTDKEEQDNATTDENDLNDKSNDDTKEAGGGDEMSSES